MDFNKLILAITDTQSHLQKKAVQSVNQKLVIRNWLIGFYIVEYEQNGQDRAKYGTKLLKSLADELKQKRVKGMSYRSLKLYRQFYQTYLQIGQPLAAQLQKSGLQIPKLLLEVLERPVKQNDFSVPVKKLLSHFSFRHFTELMAIDNPLKRTFYEQQAIKGNWSARELKRHIHSLLLERMGLSKDKKALLKSIQNDGAIERVEDMMKESFLLDFLGLEDRPSYSEHDLETALIDKIQEFLQELGIGFCFEGRQKRITVENEHDRIDLVFYHRILKCHVLIDLKIRAFHYNDVGQMNFYLNYYKENVVRADDNPPIGIVLCTDKHDAKVKYALGGIDNQLFVSKYMLALPSEEELQAIIQIED